ncbi:MAG: hypothetical protein HZB38_14855 [Planctomycetes bacterium]|nr:hypothetical protein [Planctomycetota bacterium]
MHLHARYRLIPLLASLMLLAPATASAQNTTLAIVPFSAPKADKELNGLGHGAAELLKLKLMPLPTVDCLDRETVTKATAGASLDDPAEIARRGKTLNADRIIAGSYVIEGDDVSLTVLVLDCRTGAELAKIEKKAARKRIVDTMAEVAADVVASYAKQAQPVDLRTEVIDAPNANRIILSEKERKALLVDARPTAEAFEEFGKGLADPDPYRQIRYFNEALKKDKTFYQAYLYRGLSHLAQQHAEMGLDDFDNAIKAAKSWPEPYRQKGRVYEQLGRLGLASSAYQKYVDLAAAQHPYDLKEIKKKLQTWKDTGADQQDAPKP